MKLWTLLLIAAAAWGCTPIDADRITAKDLAAVHSDFAGLSSSLDLGPAPAAGSRRTLRAVDLARIAREQNVIVTKPSEVCFERIATQLSAERLLPVLRESLGKPAQIEVLDYSRTALPSGQLEFPASGLTAAGLWRGRLLYGDRRSVPLWVRVRISDAETGEPVLLSTRSTIAEIGRGETVRVEVSSGGVLLAFDASAESSGHVGEAITVRNPTNGQRFRAVVEAKGKAVIRK
jgi:hypothetical protein